MYGNGVWMTGMKKAIIPAQSSAVPIVIMMARAACAVAAAGSAAPETAVLRFGTSAAPAIATTASASASRWCRLSDRGQICNARLRGLVRAFDAPRAAPRSPQAVKVLFANDPLSASGWVEQARLGILGILGILLLAYDGQSAAHPNPSDLSDLSDESDKVPHPADSAPLRVSRALPVRKPQGVSLQFKITSVSIFLRYRQHPPTQLRGLRSKV